MRITITWDNGDKSTFQAACEGLKKAVADGTIFQTIQTTQMFSDGFAFNMSKARMVHIEDD